MTRRVVSLGETAEDRKARIDRAVLDGTATDVVAGDGAEGYFAETMTEAPTTSGKGGGGSRKAARSKKRDAWFCPSCNLADCEHRPKRGRPRLPEPKSKTLRVYLPRELRLFLQRSNEESGLQLTDILEAVLDSEAMRCWRLHADYQAPEYSDEDGNDIEETAYDEAIRNRERRWRSYPEQDAARLHFLKKLRQNIGPRFEERVTSSLLDRVRHVGKLGKQPPFGAVRYSDTRFCSYCIEHYRDLLALIRTADDSAGGGAVSSTKDEAQALKAMAKTCPACSPQSA
jgi:hypothetical protein